MDVGQILMQLSTGVASTASAPAAAEMATVEQTGQSDSSFAGMLRGKSADTADALTKGMAVVPDSGVETTVLKPADVNTEMMAALLAVVGTRDQMPAAMVTDAEDNQEKPVESAQQDALMSQDVALLAAEPQMILSEEGNGRMPKSEQTVEPQNKPEKSEISVKSAQPDALMLQDVALLAAGPQMILWEEGNGRMPKSEQTVEPQNKPEKSEISVKSVKSAQPDALMLQDMMLLVAGTPIVLPAEVNDRIPKSGQSVELQGKHVKSVESAQQGSLMPQNVTRLAAGEQITLLAGVKGRIPESDQTVEPQNNDRNLLRRSASNVGVVAMSASAENGLSRTPTTTQQSPSAELSQSDMTTPTADSILNGESRGKMGATVTPNVVASEVDLDNLESSTTLNSPPASLKGGVGAPTIENAPDVQRSVEAKALAAQSGSSKEISTVKADVDIHPIAEKQMDVPADVRVIQASTKAFPNPAISLKESGIKKSGNQEDEKLRPLDVATGKKNMESVSADVAKVVPASAAEKELLNEGGKDTSDHGMNGQFSQTASQQKVKADMGTALGNTPGASQKDASHNDMSENVFRQVKEVLVNREVKAGNDQITMKLTPEHLGELTLNFKMENQQLKVEIVAANRGARDALMQQAENLKESLARQNITMESFDVVTSGGQRGFEQNDRGWKQLAQQNFMAGSSAGGYRYRVPDVDATTAPQFGIQKQYAMVDVHY